jgi:hypothetical protein
VSKRAKKQQAVVNLEALATPHEKLRIVCNQLLAWVMTVDLSSSGWTIQLMSYGAQVQQYKREVEQWNARKAEEKRKCGTADS